MEGFRRMDTDNNISSSTKSFIIDLSDVLDSRIAEITDQLQGSKKDILDSYKEMVDKTDKDSFHLKDFLYSLQESNTSDGPMSYNNMKKLRDNLDEYLNEAKLYIDIYDKFSKGNLSKIITSKKEKFSFIHYKIKNKNGKEDVTWNPIQLKSNFSLKDDGKKIEVDYSGCYNMFVSQNVFSQPGKYFISMEVICTSTNNYHSIGLVNENHVPNSTCVCCKNECFFMVDRSGNTFNGGLTSSFGAIKFDDKFEPYLMEFMIDLEDENDKKWTYKLNEEEIGPFKLTGKEFKIAVGMCNGGKVNYTFV
jgi:hypothetical protein